MEPSKKSPPSVRWQSASVVFSASIVMAATLPGRTHGLGLITTRLLDDFPLLTDTKFAQINLVATLLGSLFCLPCGWFLDRLRARVLIALALPALAAICLCMSWTHDSRLLVTFLTLTRGVGQSMLSVISITMLGKWFRREAGVAMGSYAVVMTMMMAIGTYALGERVTAIGWREAWGEMSWVLLALTPLAFIFARKPREVRPAAQLPTEKSSTDSTSAKFSEALCTPCFWVFALSISLFGLVSSGISLFQQLILEERNLSEAVYHRVLVIGLLSGMVANLVGGWLAHRWQMARLLAIAMLLLAVSLAALPLLQTPLQAYIQAIVAGIAGGLITVLFFAVWSHAYGPQFLGRIQSSAQMMTVLASAIGPVVVAIGRSYTGNYLVILASLAAASLFLAIVAAITNVPCAAQGAWRNPAELS